MCNYLGNKELLKRRKIGFLASRKISSSAILPTLDWAVEISKRTDVAVVSGFHSRLEKMSSNSCCKASAASSSSLPVVYIANFQRSMRKR